MSEKICIYEASPLNDTWVESGFMFQKGIYYPIISGDVRTKKKVVLEMVVGNSSITKEFHFNELHKLFQIDRNSLIKLIG